MSTPTLTRAEEITRQFVFAEHAVDVLLPVWKGWSRTQIMEALLVTLRTSGKTDRQQQTAFTFAVIARRLLDRMEDLREI